MSLIFINGLDCHILSHILKFADDTKLFGTVNTEAHRVTLQNDLDILTQWAQTWQMKFNVENCKVMHLGCHNVNSDYYVNGQLLQKTKAERDLGITITDDGKVAGQCEQAYCKANRMLGLVKYRHPKILIKLYTTLVRPHMQYRMSAWNPHFTRTSVSWNMFSIALPDCSQT